MTIAPGIRISEASGITFLNIDNHLASGRLSLFGGHILSYIPKCDNQERLWLSPHAYLNGERPIRGGIPVCWPWFSDDHGRDKGELPSHGFLRSQVWQLIESEDTKLGTRVVLSPSFSRGDGFEYDCQVTLEVLFGASLDVKLHTCNTGVVPFTFNTALHTYFEVPEIHNVTLEGLEGEYRDKVDDWALKSTNAPYRIEGETDRIHLVAAPKVTIINASSPVTEINSSGHDSIVVWNPWQGAASISDMDAFGFKHMLCVETAVTQDCQVQPGKNHTLNQQIVPVSI